MVLRSALLKGVCPRNVLKSALLKGVFHRNVSNNYTNARSSELLLHVSILKGNTPTGLLVLSDLILGLSHTFHEATTNVHV